MTGYMELLDSTSPQAIENVGTATALVSYEMFSEENETRDFRFCYVLPATLEGEGATRTENPLTRYEKF